MKKRVHLINPLSPPPEHLWRIVLMRGNQTTHLGAESIRATLPTCSEFMFGQRLATAWRYTCISYIANDMLPASLSANIFHFGLPHVCCNVRSRYLERLNFTMLLMQGVVEPRLLALDDHCSAWRQIVMPERQKGRKA